MQLIKITRGKSGQRYLRRELDSGVVLHYRLVAIENADDYLTADTLETMEVK